MSSHDSTAGLANAARPAAGSSVRQRMSSGVKALEGDRIVAILGLILVLVATALTWYSRDVSVTLGAATASSSSGVSLWDVRELAAWLITGAAVFGALMPVVLTVDERSAGTLAAFAGCAIVGAVAGATVKTTVGVGPFLAIAGGILLSLGGIATTGDTVIEEPAS